MYPAVSLDGFIAKPDGDSYSWVNQADEARYDQAVVDFGCVLVGHKTYEEYKEDFRSKKNVITFVCTQKSNMANEETIKFISGTPEEMLQKVGEHGFSEIIICGGGEINGVFAAAGLVDEIIISIQPAILGEGIPLLAHTNQSLTWNSYRVMKISKAFPRITTKSSKKESYEV